MRELGAVVRTEFRLQVRDLAFWALLAAWQVALVFSLVMSAGLPPAMRVWSTLSGFLPLLGAAAALYFASVLGRELDRRFSDVVDALPHRTQAMVFGKLLAAIAIWLVFGVETLAVLVALQVRSGLPVSGLSTALAFMGAAFVALLVSAAGIGALAATALGGGRLVYAGAVGGWLLLVAMGPTVLAHLSVETRWLDAFSPPVLTEAWSQAWDIFARERLAWSQNLWQVGLGVSMAGLAALIHKRWRDRDFRRKVAAAVTALGVVTAACGMTGYLGAYCGIRTAFAEEVAGHERAAADLDPAPWLAVVSYSLDLDLGPGHELAVRGQLTVKNLGPSAQRELPFTLNADLTLDAFAAAGESAPAVEALERDGHFLLVRLRRALLPGETARYAFDCHGEVWSWDLGWISGWGPHLVAGVDRHGVWLPAGYCWYPAPGHQRIAEVLAGGDGPDDNTVVALRYRPIRYTPATYEVTLRGWRELEYGASIGVLPAAESAGRSGDVGVPSASGRTTTEQGIFIYGAPESADFTEGDCGPVLVSPGLGAAGRALSAELARVRDVLNGLLPGPDVGPLAVLALPSSAVCFGSPSPGEGVVLSEWAVAGYGKPDPRDRDADLAFILLGSGSPPGFEPLDLWLGPSDDIRGPEDWSVRRAFRAFLAAVTVGELYGREQYVWTLEQVRDQNSRQVPSQPGDCFTVVLEALDRIYTQDGLGGTGRAVTALWHVLQAETVTVAGALEAVSGGR